MGEAGLLQVLMVTDLHHVTVRLLNQYITPRGSDAKFIPVLQNRWNYGSKRNVSHGYEMSKINKADFLLGLFGFLIP